MGPVHWKYLSKVQALWASTSTPAGIGKYLCKVQVLKRSIYVNTVQVQY